MSISEILSKAADFLLSKKWIRGANFRMASDDLENESDYLTEKDLDEVCGCCMEGAIRAVLLGETRISYSAVQLYVESAAALGRPIYSYNDEVCKSKRQAVSILRKASKLAAKEGK